MRECKSREIQGKCGFCGSVQHSVTFPLWLNPSINVHTCVTRSFWVLCFFLFKRCFLYDWAFLRDFTAFYVPRTHRPAVFACKWNVYNRDGAMALSRCIQVPSPPDRDVPQRGHMTVIVGPPENVCLCSLFSNHDIHRRIFQGHDWYSFGAVMHPVYHHKKCRNNAHTRTQHARTIIVHIFGKRTPDCLNPD